MFKKLFFVLTFFFLTTSVFADGVFPSGPTNEVDVECPVACPCCYDAMGDVQNAVLSFNDILKDINSRHLKGLWPAIQEMDSDKKDAAERSQSSNPAVAEQGMADWKEQYGEMKETEDVFRKSYDDQKQNLDDLGEAAQDAIAAVDKVLACECLAEECDTAALTDLKKQMQDTLEMLPDIRTATSNNQLAILSGLVNPNKANVDNANRLYDDYYNKADKLNKINTTALEALDDCCKKGKDECGITDDYGKGYIPLDWLVGGWAVGASLSGHDVATGKIGELTLTNYTGEKINWVIPAGTVLYPGEGDTQRMMITETIRGTLEPGATVTVPTEGACLDSGLFPPSLGVSDSDITFGGTVPSFDFLRGLPSLSEVFDEIETYFSNSTVPDLSSIFSMPETPGFSYSDIVEEINDIFGENVWGEYIIDLVSIPYFSDIVKAFMGSPKYMETGLPEGMDFDTLLQWAIWSITDGFDAEDGYDKISDQVEESGGTQTPEQISSLNTTIWGNIDLVKKQTRSDAFGAGKRSDILDRSSNLNLAWFDTFKQFFGLAKDVEAQDMPSKQEAMKIAMKNVIASSYVLSMEQNIIFDVKKLSKLAYAKKVGKISNGKLEAIRKRLDKIIKASKSPKVKFNKDKKVSVEDLLKVESVKKAFVGKGGELEGLWDIVKKQINKSYKVWDKKFISLVKKGNKAKDKGKDFESVLSREEIKFVKVFTRVKLYYKVLDNLYK